MKRLRRFFLNAVLLGATTIFMRSVAVIFNAYISGKIGAEGMGLYSLITSVYGFAVTLATSGVSLAVVRLVSEELGKPDPSGVITAMKKCVGYALVFGVSSFAILFFGAEFISERILQDSRTYLSLRVFSVALPFIALSNVFAGYFNAVRRVYKSASASIAEQFVKIALTVFFLRALLPQGIEYGALSLVLGTAIAEALSFSYLLIFYLLDKKKHLRTKTAHHDPSMTERMLRISLPIALSSYLRSGLVTVQHVLIPIGLRKHGAEYSTALASYGTIHGMVFPLILFPSAVCSTFSGLIVPELSELAATYETVQKNRHICYIVRRALSWAAIFGIGTAGILICFAEPLGILVYKSAEAAKYIRIFAPLVPVMYLDTTVDGMLKGLGQQLHSMFYNIIDASLSVFLVWSLMPGIGLNGYVICVFVTEIINLAFSLTRLLTVTEAKLPIGKAVFFPTVCIAGATAMTMIFFRMSALSCGNAVFTVSGILLSVLFYISLLRITGGLSKEDARWFRSIFQK